MVIVAAKLIETKNGFTRTENVCIYSPIPVRSSERIVARIALLFAATVCRGENTSTALAAAGKGFFGF
jgi:hypothetical protein